MNNKNNLTNLKIACDIIENKRIKLTSEFIEKILHPNEIAIYNNQSFTKSRKKEFLAGRWAAKEAIFKATKIPTAFNKLDIYYINHEPSINIEGYFITISISHERKFTIANCLSKKLTK